MYLKETLSKDEKIIKRIDKNFTFPSLVLAIGAILMVIGIKNNSYACYLISPIMMIFALLKIIGINAIEMVITNKRVISKKGIFKIETEELKLEQIESIKINSGNIIFTGTGGSKVKFSNIANIVTAKKNIESIIENREKTEIDSMNNIAKNSNHSSDMLVCPKCNTENNRINSFCSNCHYTFTREDKSGKVNKNNIEVTKEINKETEDLKEQIKILQEQIKKEKEMKQEAINKVHDREIEDLKEQIKLLKEERK